MEYALVTLQYRTRFPDVYALATEYISNEPLVIFSMLKDQEVLNDFTWEFYSFKTGQQIYTAAVADIDFTKIHLVNIKRTEETS